MSLIYANFLCYCMFLLQTARELPTVCPENSEAFCIVWPKQVNLIIYIYYLLFNLCYN